MILFTIIYCINIFYFYINSYILINVQIKNLKK